MNEKYYEYDAVIQSADSGGAYVSFPYDIRAEFGKGRVKVHANYDGEPYTGSIVNMGVKKRWWFYMLYYWHLKGYPSKNCQAVWRYCACYN